MTSDGEAPGTDPGALDAESLDLETGSAIALFAAVATGDFDTVDTLLTAQPELADAVVAGSVTDSDGSAADPEESAEDVGLGAGCTPLHLAAQSGHTAIGQRLVEAGADPDVRNAEGRTALHDAVEHGTMDLALWLVEQGAEVDICAAAILGLRERLVALAEADPEQVNDRTTHLSPLGWAAYGNQPDTARELLARGARLDDGELLCAASVGHVEVGQVLLEHGADPNAIHQGAGGNALHAAAALRYTCDGADFVDLLLAAGADPEVTTPHGLTALEIARAGARRQAENPPGEGELVRDFESVIERLVGAAA